MTTVSRIPWKKLQVGDKVTRYGDIGRISKLVEPNIITISFKNWDETHVHEWFDLTEYLGPEFKVTIETSGTHTHISTENL